MPRRTRQQAHHLNRLIRRHRKAPLARAGAEPTTQPPPPFGLQLLRSQRTRAPSGQRELHRVARRGPRIVHPLDAYPRIVLPRVHHPQSAHLVRIAPRIEHHHPVRARRTRRHIVHRSQKPVVGANVGQHLDVKTARELQPPVPRARTRALRQPLLRVAFLQVLGVEVHRLARTDAQGHRTVPHPRIVNRLDVHLARSLRTVDDARKPLVPPLRPTRRRGKQRHSMRTVRPRHRRQVRQMPRRTRQQAHRLYRLPRTHHQLPLPLAPTEHPRQSPSPRLQLLRAHRARRTRRHRHHHRIARRLPRIVNPLDAHPRRLRPRVDEPQPADLVRVAPRVEDGHLMPRLARRHHVVHRGQEPVGGADVGQHLEVECARKLKAPVPIARPNALRQLPFRVPLQVIGVEVRRLARTDAQRHRTVRHPRVVERLDVHLARCVRAVDDAPQSPGTPPRPSATPQGTARCDAPPAPQSAPAPVRRSAPACSSDSLQGERGATGARGPASRRTSCPASAHASATAPCAHAARPGRGRPAPRGAPSRAPPRPSRPAQPAPAHPRPALPPRASRSQER